MIIKKFKIKIDKELKDEIRIKNIRETLEALAEHLKVYEKDFLRHADNKAHGLCLYVKRLRAATDDLDALYKGK